MQIGQPAREPGSLEVGVGLRVEVDVERLVTRDFEQDPAQGFGIDADRRSLQLLRANPQQSVEQLDADDRAGWPPLDFAFVDHAWAWLGFECQTAPSLNAGS